MPTKARIKKLKTVAENRQANIVVVFEDLYDPHNAAAILRTSDGFGISEVHFIFKSVTPYNPRKVGRDSSSSANKWLNYVIWRSTEECYSKLKSEGYTIIATALHEKSENLYEYTWPKKIALVFGNEKEGLTKEGINGADTTVTMPMQGMVESFNVSVMAGIVLSEIFRNRNGKQKNFRIGKKQAQALYDDFIKRS